MALFKPAEVTSAFLKMGLLGFQGSGKTKTATKVTIGLIKHMKTLGVPYADKPAFFLDTETGSDWVIPDFKVAGIPLESAKTRAFSDLLEAVTEAEQNGSVLLIDSITHFWKELTESYMRKKNRTRLQFEDWGYLKGEWGKFTDRFVNSSAHIILCGRAGFEYDYSTDEESGKKNLEKTGVKMKAEGEMGYEPSLLVLMERQQEIQGSKVVRVWRTATVLKDRSTLLDGAEFEDPGFAQFLPHVQLLNLGGKQLGVDTSRNSDHLIKTDKRDWQPVQRRIVLDEITTLLELEAGGMTQEAKKNRLKLLLAHFDATWTEIEEVMPLDKLRSGYDSLHRALKNGEASRYGAAIDAAKAPEGAIDSLPDHSAATTAPAIAADPDQVAAKSLEEKLLAQLAELTTAKDAMHWAMEASHLDGVDTRMRMRLSDALTAKLTQINKAAAEAGKAEPEPAADKPRRDRKGTKASADPEGEPAPIVAHNGSGIAPHEVWLG